MQYKYVPKEYEVEVKSFQPELVQTGCVNSFGTPVPCREKRSADEAEQTEVKVEAPYYYAPTIYGAHVAAPAVAPLTYTHHVAAPVALSHPLTYAVSFTGLPTHIHSEKISYILYQTDFT